MFGLNRAAILQRLLQVLIALDQLVNASTGLFIGDGWADETLSAKAYRLRQEKGWSNAYRLINSIFFLQDNHCKAAYLSELKSRHLPPEYR